jgi:outer membrane protein assembly factor BamB
VAIACLGLLAAGGGLVWARETRSSEGQMAGMPGQDWPMFRGEAALLGVAHTNLPDKLELLWTFKTGGPVKSSAAIVGARVYIGSDDAKLYALNRANGKKVWDFAADGAIESSPLVLDGRIYFGSAGTNMFCLDAATGKKLWSFGVDDKIQGSPNWFKAPGGEANWILVGAYDYKLYCFNAFTGKTNWVYETGNFINGTPAIGDGQTAFGGCDAIVHVLEVATGRQLKEVEAGAYIAGSGAIAGGRFYVGHYENEVLAVDLNAGKVEWRFKDRSFPYFSSPAVTRDRVLIGGRDKRLHCLNRADGKELWSFATRGKVDSSPVVCRDKVVVGSDDGRLYSVSLADGKELWSYEIGQPIGGSPAVAGGRIVIGSDDGGVYCFGAKAGQEQ